MKRYYNNVNFNTNIASDRVVRTLHKGLVNEVIIATGLEKNYVVSGNKRASSRVVRNTYPTNDVNIIALKSNVGNIPVIARVVGLYKRSIKLKHRSSRRIVVRGRLVAVGTTLGYILRTSLLPRNKKLLVSRRLQKKMLRREIGKLYVVRVHRHLKSGIVYKPIGFKPIAV
jgi:hypothetical protein